MTDRERIIEGLEHCRIGDCVGCPYDQTREETLRSRRFVLACNEQLTEDILSLLKEQEADKKDAEYMLMEVIPVTIGNDYRTWFCSACGSKLHYGKELICPKCHRKIDWKGW